MDKPKSLNLEEIINRIKLLTGLTNEGAVAKLLGFSQPSLSERKERASIPYKRIAEWGLRNGYSLDWLLTGEGPMRREEAVGAAALGGAVAVRSGTERDYVEKLLKILRSGDDLIISAIIPNLEVFSARLIEKAEEPPSKKKKRA